MTKQPEPSAKRSAEHGDHKPADRLQERAEKLIAAPTKSAEGAIRIGSKSLRYAVTAGHLPVHGAKGELEAAIFYIAYTAKGPGSAKRPLMFAFNGGPGSSSVWLHLGALGPKRVPINDDGSMPRPPFGLQANPHTWLEFADLVFIDPVRTGLSLAASEEIEKRMLGVEGDIACLTAFVRLYLTRVNRWQSPLYLAGESYGTTRGAAIADALMESGIALSGLVLVSLALDFQCFVFAPKNDLPHTLFLPGYTATAWYHKRLAPALQRDLKKTLAQVEAFAAGDYAHALHQGARLPAATRNAVIARYAALTGLDPRVVEECDLRVDSQRFFVELLRDRRQVVGRLDARVTAPMATQVDRAMEWDPATPPIRGAYTAAMNHFLRDEMKFTTDQPYEILNPLFETWDWGKGNRFTSTSDALARAMRKNPHLRVFVGNGYFDLATPYYATEHQIAQLPIDAGLRRNIAAHYYHGGHMMYTSESELRQMKRDLAKWMR